MHKLSHSFFLFSQVYAIQFSKCHFRLLMQIKQGGNQHRLCKSKFMHKNTRQIIYHMFVYNFFATGKHHLFVTDEKAIKSKF